MVYATRTFLFSSYKVSTINNFVVVSEGEGRRGLSNRIDRRIPRKYIKIAKPDPGFPLFQSESLKWPGFVEFDDMNGKVLTFSAQDR
ncbi:hypothetical protein ZOSMA_2G00210 [Zostera marina]|uniref:Uncharacterized protein n=1 Tax=Zostera marina TaxID=29655 RepID=A0A0K9PAJ7_ZOSMR|nr:hypothetical protein ZOSMA_2G00210 [Zostera marina]